MSSLRFYTMIGLSAALTVGMAIGIAEAAPWLAATPPAGTATGDAKPVALTTTLPDAATPPAADATAALQVAAKSRRYRDGSFPGQIYDAYYGLVQVQANIRGGSIVSIDVLQYPADRRTSRAINSRALPLLEREVVQAQSTRVNMVSGATLTSDAFLRSLSDALATAGA